MAVFGIQLALLPTAVRQYKIQQLPFLDWRLTIEQISCFSGQLQQSDALVDVTLVGRLVRRNITHDPNLLGTELACFTIEELVVVIGDN